MDIQKEEFREISFDHFYIKDSSTGADIFSLLYEKISAIVTPCLQFLKINSEDTLGQGARVFFKKGLGDVSQRDVFVFGDIHGELGGFNENLLNAGLIDNHGKWTGKSCVMVQMGDVIDRGAKSEEAWGFLSELQEQAKAESGKVVRLTGNHELMVLQGDFRYANRVIQNPAKFAEKVKLDIIKGNVCLAYADGKRIYTHAGLRSRIREQIVSEIKEKHPEDNLQVFAEDIVDHLNGLLVRAVESNDFSHAIFQVGYSRGGNHSIGGVLWEDVSQMHQSVNARDIPQVIAHNPPRRRGEAPIRVTESKRLINVDAGLNPLYGGNQAYVIFRGSDIIIRNKGAQSWMQAQTENV